jgi:hypothetical protein
MTGPFGLMTGRYPMAGARWRRAQPAGRTIGDTTPAGIGRKPTGQDVTYTAHPAIDAPVPPGADASSIATAGLALGLVADRLIHRVRDMFRQPKG